MNAYVQSLLGILLSAILTENFILVKFYGICPFTIVLTKSYLGKHRFHPMEANVQSWSYYYC